MKRRNERIAAKDAKAAERRQPPTKEKAEEKKELSGGKRRWYSHLKYLLLLFVPAFLNHASLYREARELKPPGELYDIGLGQKLFMGCSGQGLPTVIFDAPTGKSSDAWALIAPEVAKVTKTCVYDRAGLGFSDRPFVNRSETSMTKTNKGEPHTTERMVEDFYRLFSLSSDQAKPFILVGAELGAVNIRFYTQMFEDNVAGLVLVNPLVEGMFSLIGGKWGSLWYDNLMASLQTLQFSASSGFSRIALITGLMKLPAMQKLPEQVVARQKHLHCKPGHLSSAVEEFYFTNVSLSQMRTVWRVKPFPSPIPVTILSSGTYSSHADPDTNKVWSASQTLISDVLHVNCKKIQLSGDADTALGGHAGTVVQAIRQHVDKWRRMKGLK